MYIIYIIYVDKCSSPHAHATQARELLAALTSRRRKPPNTRGRGGVNSTKKKHFFFFTALSGWFPTSLEDDQSKPTTLETGQTANRLSPTCQYILPKKSRKIAKSFTVNPASTYLDLRSPGPIQQARSRLTTKKSLHSKSNQSRSSTRSFYIHTYARNTIRFFSLLSELVLVCSKSSCARLDSTSTTIACRLYA